jgi:hypothetical protein
MRAVTVLPALLAIVLLAGPALASDYMLPVLLEKQKLGAAPGNEAPPQGTQSLPPPAQATGFSMSVALLGAFVVTAATMLFFTRRTRA